MEFCRSTLFDPGFFLLPFPLLRSGQGLSPFSRPRFYLHAYFSVSLSLASHILHIAANFRQVAAVAGMLTELFKGTMCLWYSFSLVPWELLKLLCRK